MTVASSLESMWLMVWGNSAIGAIAILATFAYLCYKKKYGIVETLYVILPVIIGMAIAPVVADRYLPAWIGGVFIMGIGAVWGLALTKIFSSFEPYVKIYIVFLTMNLALTLTGYSLAAYTYLHTGQAMDLATASQQYPTDTTAIGYVFSGSGWFGSIATVLDLFIGGGILGFFMVSGLPSWTVNIIAIPVAFLAVMSLLPLMRGFVELIKTIWDTPIGKVALAAMMAGAIYAAV
ncbi:MAG: hypothetical protein Q8L68_01705 [Methylococcales bacterium]|nr:hypothetical protein [Methylococcales bacterium]